MEGLTLRTGIRFPLILWLYVSDAVGGGVYIVTCITGPVPTASISTSESGRRN